MLTTPEEPEGVLVGWPQIVPLTIGCANPWPTEPDFVSNALLKCPVRFLAEPFTPTQFGTEGTKLLLGANRLASLGLVWRSSCLWAPAAGWASQGKGGAKRSVFRGLPSGSFSNCVRFPPPSKVPPNCGQDTLCLFEPPWLLERSLWLG